MKSQLTRKGTTSTGVDYTVVEPLAEKHDEWFTGHYVGPLHIAGARVSPIEITVDGEDKTYMLEVETRLPATLVRTMQRLGQSNRAKFGQDTRVANFGVQLKTVDGQPYQGKGYIFEGSPIPELHEIVMEHFGVDIKDRLQCDDPHYMWGVGYDGLTPIDQR
jgi:hypothetical protein